MQIVILGAGQAATSMAARLRARGHDGPITVVGAEPVAPYQRPPLSKAYLLGQMGLDRLLLRGADWWAEQRIDLRLSERALSIDRAARTVTTDRGQIPYDALALTLGATPRRLPAAMGGNLPGTHTIRNLEDVQAMAPDLQPGRKLIVIGGGYIGLEGAAVARKMGLDVTLLESAPRILGRVAAAETADLIRDLHLAHGVRIREGVRIRRVTGTDHATGIELADGQHLPADLILTGIGVTPDTGIAEAAGLIVENGIVTDQFGTTSDPAIWAAGDCASFPGPVAHLRLESVGNAIDMAETVADNILGARKPYQAKPWFWSDQFDAKLQIAGLSTGYDHVVTRAAEGAHAGSVWYYNGDSLIAVDALNDARAYMIGKRLIEAGKSPDPALIPATPDLKALL
ncbi:NAD(P)/FAD-dependent oxidoreductase [Paracoccus fistulariae]|uniref:FAD-dependent oxidoreductase n=1 Tax=Paracoccus fistulariae TaxID=658446 RepID=A0ABY7SG68_9RHOB|nr:FAD-dependent oxidoreductase [Paracoccus fistulariae]MDB6181931.1 FAD-dependent oxidoreductase [Paracoccus fistulariae]WCR05786.1 FAD-dependent oxidoreductase [Paracoccus fistulariae]